MHLKRLAVISMLSCLPFGGAIAADSSVSVYYIPNAEFEADGGFDDDGDGFGISGQFKFARSFAFVGEYQSTNYDDTDIDLDQLRLGAGWFAEQSNSGIYADYINAEVDDDDADGFGIHGRLAGMASDQLELFAEVGWNMLEDDDGNEFDGIEYRVGGAFAFSPQLGAFVDYRVTNLEDDANDEVEFTDLRVGARFTFGS